MKKHLLLGLMLLAALPARPATEGSQAKLKLPWEALKKILHLDNDEVSLTAQEFQTLLKNAGVKTPPEHAQTGGRVILKKADFEKLLQSLVPPPPQPPLVHLTKGSYRGRLEKDSLRFDATLRLHVRKKTGKSVKVDLFPASAGFREALLDGNPALVEVQNGRLVLNTEKTGDMTVSLGFSVRVPEADTRQQAHFPVARTPVTELVLEIPQKNLDIKVEGALHENLRSSGRGTEVQAFLSPTEGVTVSWNPILPEAEKGPAKVYVDAAHLLSVEDDALRTRSRLRFQVLRNTVNRVVMSLPEGFSVLDVQGDSIGEWRDDGKTLTVPFSHARKDGFELTVACERVLAADKSTATFGGLPVEGAVREKGFVGVELKTTAELPSPAAEGLERVDIRELPPEMLAQTDRPLLYGYRYLRPPFRLALGVDRHEDVSVLSSVIDLADGQTFFLEDGKRLHRITYTVRNSWKQFLEVTLPEGARLWSAFVDGQPVKPSAGEKGRLLIPLSRPVQARGAAGSFPVELVTFEEKSPLRLLGRADFRFPIPDMTVSRLTWAVYAPENHRYAYLGRDLERLPPPAPWRPMPAGSVRSRRAFPGRDYLMRSMGEFDAVKMAGNKASDDEGLEDQRMTFADVPVAAGAVAMAVEEPRKEKSDGSAMQGLQLPGAPPQARGYAFMSAPAAAPQETAGVLPIRVQVPAMGRAYFFAKTLPLRDAPVSLPLYHFSLDLLTALERALVLAALALLFQFRRPLITRARERALPLLRRISGSPLSLSPGGAFAASAALCPPAAFLGPVPLLFFLLLFMAAAAWWLATLARQGDRS